MLIQIHVVVNVASIRSDVLKAAYQLESFQSTGHAFASFINPSIPRVIKYLIATNFRPRDLELATVQDRNTRARSSSASLEPGTVIWNQDWAIDRQRYRSDLRIFMDATTDLAASLNEDTDLASTGNSPERLPSSTQPASSESSSNRNSESVVHNPESTSTDPSAASRGTSAEEVIYSLPIRPVVAGKKPAKFKSKTLAPTSSTSSAQQTTIMPIDEATQRLIDAVIDSYVARHPPRSGPAGPAGPSGPPGPPGEPGHDAAGPTVAGTRWNPEDLGFLDPMYDGKSASTGPPIEHVGKETYFRDVHLFVERAKEIAIIKGGELTRNNIWMSLRGTALEWYTAELTEVEKRILKYGNGDTIEEWANLLTSQFKKPANIAIDAMLHERYTLKDAASQREPHEYAQKILRSAKDAGLTVVKNQLDMIYNGIDLELRRDIRRPDEQSTLSSYLADIDENKHEWWAYAARHQVPSHQGGGQLQSRQGRPQDSRSSQFGQSEVSGRGGFQSYNSRPYQSSQQAFNSPSQYQNQYSDQYSNAGVNRLPTPPARLQITAGTNQINDANSFTFRQPFRPGKGNNRGGYQGSSYQNQNRGNYSSQYQYSNQSNRVGFAGYPNRGTYGNWNRGNHGGQARGGSLFQLNRGGYGNNPGFPP